MICLRRKGRPHGQAEKCVMLDASESFLRSSKAQDGLACTHGTSMSMRRGVYDFIEP